MLMFKCNSCGAEFEEPRVKRSWSWEFNAYDREELCPECGSDDIEEGRDCPKCGAYRRYIDDFCTACTQEKEKENGI